jgi:hypothetical protein
MSTRSHVLYVDQDVDGPLDWNRNSKPDIKAAQDHNHRDDDEPEAEGSMVMLVLSRLRVCGDDLARP